MTLVINILLDILNEGLMYALLAMGMYITYSILDFPDLSVTAHFRWALCSAACLS